MKRRVKKQSGDKASRIAGRGLRILAKSDAATWTVRVSELKTLCASVLSQDETKGPRK